MRVLKKGNYILWLASWYPNKQEPFNGDFIQRHARATAPFIPITVFHFVQAGAQLRAESQEEAHTESKGLQEIVYYPKHLPVPSVLNKLFYNIRFYRQAKNRLLQHFEKNGLPIGVHVHVPMKGGNLALWIKRNWNIPYILSEHSSAYVPQVSDHFFKRSPIYRHQVRSIFKSAVVVTNVSLYIGDVLKRIFNLKQIEVVRNVVDTNLFFYVQNNVPPPFTFLHVSTLNAVKNIDGILRAFSTIKKNEAPWQLVLVGPVSEALIDAIAQYELKQQVRLTGLIGYEQVAEEMKKAHAFVLFSQMENFPCVVVEALCCGVPIVAGEVSGVPEAVNETNGILVPKDNEAALASALRQMIRQYKNFDRPAISADAQARYNYQVIGLQIFNLYQSAFSMAQ